MFCIRRPTEVHRLCLVLVAVSAAQVKAAETVDFNRDIRPLLSDRCFQCHGPDEEARQADLRLDVAEGEHGPFADRGDVVVISPGSPAKSALWQRITTDDPDLRMPPPEAHLPPLTSQQRAQIQQWISSGAEYRKFWAFMPPQRQTAPTVDAPRWNRNRIDRFVAARLESEGLEASPPAIKRALIRRVTFDLTGLPPTPAEIHRFEDDHGPDAYERVVDRLLASPHYGEHMAKYWLDLVRFADTNGIHHDHFREVTPYRDWVIRAFNDNLPFDQFLTFQIAGDLYDHPTTDQLIASGFNRMHLVIDKGTALPEESFHRNVVDRVTAFGVALLGLTVQCAECHDHKYDPITQRDFYQLYAFFNNIDATPETPGRNPHPPLLELPTDEQRARRDALDAQLLQLQVKITRLKQEVGDGSDAPPKAELAAAEQRHAELTKEQESLQSQIRTTLIMKERDEVRPTHIHIRGAYDQFGDEVDRDTPSFLPPMQAAGEMRTRMDLAEWVTDSGNPLVARVAVNRFWQQLFGVGLVKTAEDFGMQGDWPSHPELLDDLASRFVDDGWDVKDLMKSIVMSQTYRQTSHAAPEHYRQDPQNRLLARGSRFRMDSEMVRDQILAVTGLLVDEMYGKSVKPPQPPNLWKTVSMVSSSTYAFQADAGDDIFRRSIYTFWKRAQPPPQMTIFDAPTRERCIARRERTNTPLQALVLMNEEQYFQAARHMAIQLLANRATADHSRLVEAYEAVTSHRPDAAELSMLENHLQDLRSTYRSNPTLASQLAGDRVAPADMPPVEIAAYTMVINSLLNLDVTKTRE